MKTLASSLALAATLALSSVASADVLRADLSFEAASQPTLQLVRGGGADRPDPFAELREKRRQLQSQKHKSQNDGAPKNERETGGKDQMSKSKDKSGGGFFGLFGS